MFYSVYIYNIILAILFKSMRYCDILNFGSVVLSSSTCYNMGGRSTGRQVADIASFI